MKLRALLFWFAMLGALVNACGISLDSTAEPATGDDASTPPRPSASSSSSGQSSTSGSSGSEPTLDATADAAEPDADGPPGPTCAVVGGIDLGSHDEILDACTVAPQPLKCERWQSNSTVIQAPNCAENCSGVFTPKQLLPFGRLEGSARFRLVGAAAASVGFARNDLDAAAPAPPDASDAAPDLCSLVSGEVMVVAVSYFDGAWHLQLVTDKASCDSFFDTLSKTQAPPGNPTVTLQVSFDRGVLHAALEGHASVPLIAEKGVDFVAGDAIGAFTAGGPLFGVELDALRLQSCTP